MLILTRQVGETLLIGDDVKVTVLAVDGYQVKLGTSAPADVVVLRQEIAPVTLGKVPHSGEPRTD